MNEDRECMHDDHGSSLLEEPFDFHSVQAAAAARVAASVLCQITFNILTKSDESFLGLNKDTPSCATCM